MISTDFFIRWVATTMRWSGQPGDPVTNVGHPRMLQPQGDLTHFPESLVC